MLTGHGNIMHTPRWFRPGGLKPQQDRRRGNGSPVYELEGHESIESNERMVKVQQEASTGAILIKGP